MSVTTIGHPQRVAFVVSGGAMRRTDLVVNDDSTVDEIDRAIVYALDAAGLDPRIREAFIDALLDKRNRATQRA